jgi:undecaprenyl-diphosphatase
MHEAVIFVAKYFILIPVIVAAVVWLRLPAKEKLRFAVLAVLGAAIAYGLAKLGSALFYNPRPFVAGHFTPYFAHGADNGFPSDHTLLAGALAALVFSRNRRWGWLLFAVALLIGLSRVIAGVHHLIDILGAIAFGCAGMWLASVLVGRLWPQRYQIHKSE